MPENTSYEWKHPLPKVFDKNGTFRDFNFANHYFVKAINSINKSQILFKHNQMEAEKEADKRYMKFIKLKAIKDDKMDNTVERIK